MPGAVGPDQRKCRRNACGLELHWNFPRIVCHLWVMSSGTHFIAGMKVDATPTPGQEATPTRFWHGTLRTMSATSIPRQWSSLFLRSSQMLKRSPKKCWDFWRRVKSQQTICMGPRPALKHSSTTPMRCSIFWHAKMVALVQKSKYLYKCFILVWQSVSVSRPRSWYWLLMWNCLILCCNTVMWSSRCIRGRGAWWRQDYC